EEYDSPSRYEILVSKLEPLLSGTKISQLSWDDILFLHHETKYPLREISFLVDDMRLSQKTGIPNAIFFGLGMNEVGILQPEEFERIVSEPRSEPLIDLLTVLELPVKKLIQTLQIAIKNGQIPASITKKLENIGKRFSELISSNSEESIKTKRNRIKELGLIAGLDENTAKIFSKRLDNVLISKDIWENLVNEGVIRESKIKELKLIIELAELTDNNIELVKNIKS